MEEYLTHLGVEVTWASINVEDYKKAVKENTKVSDSKSTCPIALLTPIVNYT